jgi:hypothetical protein
MITRVVISRVVLVNDALLTLASMFEIDASVVMESTVDDEIGNSVDVVGVLTESGSEVDDDVKEVFICVLAITISVRFVISTVLVTLVFPDVEAAIK